MRVGTLPYFKQTSFGSPVRRGPSGRRRMPKQNPSFHLRQLPIRAVGLESPLRQGLRNRLPLIRKCAEKVDVLHLPLFVDDDAHRHRIESAFSKYRIDAGNHILGAGEILNADRSIPPAPAVGSASAGNFMLFRSSINFSSSFVSRLLSTIFIVWHRISVARTYQCS